MQIQIQTEMQLQIHVFGKLVIGGNILRKQEERTGAMQKDWGSVHEFDNLDLSDDE